MHSTPTTSRSARLDDEVARHRIGVAGVVASQASEIAPATIVFGVVPTAVAVTGLVGVPVAMIAVALALYIFLVGYLAMARHIPNPGAFYAYISQGIWKPLGVGAAWLALASYLCFLNATFTGFGFTASALSSEFVAGVPWWALSGVAVVIVGLLAIRRIDITGKVLAVFVIAETLAVIVCTIAAIAAPVFHFSAAAMDPSQLWGSDGAKLFVIAINGYVGYEAAAVYVRDSRNPKRTVPRASYITLIGVALVYWFASWVQISAAGPDVVERAVNEGPDLFGNQAAVSIGDFAVTMNQLLFSTSIFASALAFQNVSARYLAVLGQERVLPRRFGRTVKEAPRYASVTLSLVSAVVVIIYATFGFDPLVQGLFWLGTGGALGVLLLSAATSVAVIGYFGRDSRGESLWHRAVAPALATIVLGVAGILALDNLETLYGEGSETISEITPVLVLVLVGLGVLWGLILRATRPRVYAGIGLGIESTSSTFDALFAADDDNAKATTR
jgi:amino acid transporter